MKTDIFQAITDKIIESLEAGVKPWVCPWDDSGCSAMPSNFLSHQFYHGANILVLWMASYKNGYQNSQWLTFKQAQSIGGHIKKGEHGTRGFYFNFVEKEDATESTKTVMVPFVKSFTLFNLEQTEGIVADTPPIDDSVKINPVQRAEEVIKRSGAIIKHCGGSALYSPTTDMITMPEKIGLPIQVIIIVQFCMS